ncbi:hypothetical protein ONE63_011483 [Megalurothrips usitatus]|uniref:Reverse transcriptase domain-containing protein n=1 Tax=Megalurothrips usitatus TaxID=439358 RepID=A0AAV7X357_9NEOP|nr:hypothetical protein ONE63_011483 [Megalurothrips usitatus]
MLRGLKIEVSPQMAEIIDIVLTDVSVGRVDEAIEAFVLDIAKTKPKRKARGSKKTQNSKRKKRAKRSAKRAEKYKRYQQLYEKKVAQLAEEILDGKTDEVLERPDMATLGEFFEQTYADKQLKWPKAKTNGQKHLYYPITWMEVRTQISKLKQTAAGSDGVEREHLRNARLADLMALFNIIWGMRYIPAILRVNRTVLLPKKGDLRDPKNWRPITISSLILRTLNKIVSKRIEATITLHHSQRGFTQTDGIVANTAILQAVIRECKSKARQMMLLSIDLAKAFDRVTPHSIEDALNRQNIDSCTIQYIMANYKNLFTVLECCGDRSDPIQIRRGVKQGDPLSGILFNLILDELMRILAKHAGIEMNGENISALGFADDTVLLAKDAPGMRKHLRELDAWLNKHAMEVNAKKCSAYQSIKIAGTKRTALETSSLFQIGEEKIPALNTSSQLSYLGHAFKSTGQTAPTPARLEQMLARLQEAPLKPWQKLHILSRFLIPRIFHAYQTPAVTAQKLKYVDGKIRSFVKATLHLPKTTPTAFIHAPIRAGGLSVPCLRQQVCIVYKRRLEKLSLQGDAQVKAALSTETFRGLMEKLERISGGLGSRRHMSQRYWQNELHQSALGEGLKDATSKCGAWVLNPPTFWKGRDYIAAVHLRIGLLPTRGAPYVPTQAAICRNPSCRVRESLYHVLQRCPVTHWPRVQRHDAINKTLKDSLKRAGHSVQDAPRFTTQSDRYVPDLLVVSEDKEQAWIIETTVVWEHKDALSKAYDLKYNKYNKPDLLERIREDYRVTNVIVLPYVVGARGCWTSTNQEIWTTFNLPEAAKQIASTAALQWGATIHRHFMRSVWRRPT